MKVTKNGKHVLQKMFLKDEYRTIFLNIPTNLRSIIENETGNADVQKTLEGTFDFIHYFATQKAELDRDIPHIKKHLKNGALLWVSYPKGKVLPTDLKRDIVADTLKAMQLQVVSQVAIDDTWSALRFKQL